MPPPAVRSLPEAPGPLWRFGSSAVMGITGLLCKTFLYGLNRVETQGLDNFLRVLDDRKGVGRKRGLITACNHISVLDDPIMWGVLPLRYSFNPQNLRWGLGAHDICFKNRFSSTFFGLGQVLPTYRLKHSPQGGLYQPTVTEAIHLLSAPPCTATSPGTSPPHPHSHLSWLHVFPEGCVHQHPASTLRYFKWGISRLILESTPTPSFIPIFIDGMQNLMPEDRGFPRFFPRVRRKIRVVLGDEVDVGRVFGDQVARWDKIKHLVKGEPGAGAGADEVEAWKEAARIRVEVARRAREEVMKVRRGLGYPDDKDETLGLAETWAREKTRSPRTTTTTTVDGEHMSTKR